VFCTDRVWQIRIKAWDGWAEQFQPVSVHISVSVPDDRLLGPPAQPGFRIPDTGRQTTVVGKETRIVFSPSLIGYPPLMNAETISAVAFDAGGTLIYCDPSPAEIYATQLSRHGRTVRAEDVGPVFKQAWAEMQRRTAPGRDRYSSAPGGERAWWGEFVQEVLKRLDHDAPWEPLLHDLYAAFSDREVWQAFPETAATLSDLKARGVSLAVISNWDRRLPEILRALDFIDVFDVVTVSAIEGVEKPAPEIFQKTLDRLGVAAANTIHVGDSPLEDYAGAEAAGLQALLIDRHELFTGDGYRRIASLAETLDFLE